MATLPITFTAGSETGATIRRIAYALEQIAQDLPDRMPTGASTVLTIDNAPSSGTASVQITAGPITTPLYRV
jgi:hypothetical protein